MSRVLVVINSLEERQRIAKWAMNVKLGTRVEFKETKRSLPQNDRFWAMLTDVSLQAVHCGRKYTPDEWKIIFLHAIGREIQFLPSLDEKTFVPWGQSSSDLSKEEMSDLMEFMSAWCAEHGVTFSEPTTLAKQVAA